MTASALGEHDSKMPRTVVDSAVAPPISPRSACTAASWEEVGSLSSCSCTYDIYSAQYPVTQPVSFTPQNYVAHNIDGPSDIRIDLSNNNKARGSISVGVSAYGVG